MAASTPVLRRCVHDGCCYRIVLFYFSFLDALSCYAQVLGLLWLQPSKSGRGVIVMQEEMSQEKVCALQLLFLLFLLYVCDD